MERIRDTSLLLRLAFGLKSQSLAILSHSWPGSISVGVPINSFSAVLQNKSIWLILCNQQQRETLANDKTYMAASLKDYRLH
jgi:hypothetical protein